MTRLGCMLMGAFAAIFLSIPLLAERAGAEEVLLRLAELHPTDHPTTRADYEFARLVGERSKGRIRIAVYPGSVLGQEISVLEQVQFGAIDIARVSLSAVATYVPMLNALQMPYLYRDADQMWRILKGAVGRELLESVSTAGFVGLCFFEAGARSFYNSMRPIRFPSDLGGLRIRVQESKLMADTVAAFGALPVPMAFGEAYSALVSRAIDGAENNAPTYLTSRHYQVARYCSLSEHVRIPEIVVGSGVSFASLSAADRDLIAGAAMDTIDFQRSAWASYDRMAWEEVRTSGVEIFLPKDLGPWRALASRLYGLQTPEIRALVERIRSVR
jgi:tripartite ATP-independent transporter DctP family solute receptor